MPELLVRTALPNFNETQPLQNRDHFLRFEDGNRHGSSDLDGLDANKLRLQGGFAVFE